MCDNAPVYLIHATDTRAPTREIVKSLASTYPTWHVHQAPSGGHMAPLARPDLVNPLIAKASPRRTIDHTDLSVFGRQSLSKCQGRL